jgi:hypothetical protein
VSFLAAAMTVLFGCGSASLRTATDFEEILSGKDRQGMLGRLDTFIWEKGYDRNGYCGPQGGIGRLHATD